MAKRRKSDVRPERCPQCGSFHIAEIVYNNLMLSDKLKADLEAGRSVRGGFRISFSKPEWRCIDCGSEFYWEAS